MPTFVFLRRGAACGRREITRQVARTPVFNSPQNPPHCVGRRAELARVQDALHDVVLGTGSALIFGGDRGVGKSRLLSECAALKSPVAVIGMRCAGAALGERDLRAQLAAALSITGARATTRSAADVMSGIVTRAKRKPIALLVDDAHAANAGELRLIDGLLALTQRHRLVVVACVFDPSIEGAPFGWGTDRWRRAGVEYHSLDPLADADVELLIRSVGQRCAHPLGNEDVREMMRAAQGNPRLAIEFAGSPPQSRGLPLVAASARAEVASIRHSLSPSEFDTLLACSVLGESFSDAAVAPVAGRSCDAVADALQHACALGVLLEDPGDSGRLCFRHAAVRNVLYASLVSLKRRILHERAIQHAIAAGGDAQSLGRHWEVLGDHQRAAECFSRAADEQFATAAFAPAADLYERAAMHLPVGSNEWVRAQRFFVSSCNGLGDWERMLPALASVLAAIDRAGDPESAIEFLWHLFLAQLNNGDLAAAERASEELAAIDSPAARAHAQNAVLTLAYGLCYRGQLAAAARLADSVDPTELVSDEARIRYAITHAEIGALRTPLERSLERIDEAVTIATALAVRGTVLCYRVGAEIAERFGDLPKAREYVDRATAFVSSRAGTIDDSRLGIAMELMRICLLAGDLPAARDLLQSTNGRRKSGRHNEAFYAGAGVAIGMCVGDLALVDAFFNPDLLFASAAAGDAESCGLLLPGFAEVMRAHGMIKELAAVLERCVNAELIDPHAAVQLHAVRFAGLECAKRAAEQTERHFRDAVAPAAAAHIALCNATLLRRCRRHSQAAEAARDAAARYRHMGWRLHEAAALELAGDSSGARHAYEQCGAIRDAARLAAGQTRKSRRAPFGAHLTAREADIVRLIVRKRSNPEIARALEISLRTVQHHVEAAFSKLGVRARWQLTAELLEASGIAESRHT